jgi:hypothetical protein
LSLARDFGRGFLWQLAGWPARPSKDFWRRRRQGDKFSGRASSRRPNKKVGLASIVVAKCLKAIVAKARAENRTSIARVVQVGRRREKLHSG